MTKELTPVKNETQLTEWINGVSDNLKEYSDNADSKFFKSALIAISENSNLMKNARTNERVNKNISPMRKNRWRLNFVGLSNRMAFIMSYYSSKFNGFQEIGLLDS